MEQLGLRAIGFGSARPHIFDRFVRVRTSGAEVEGSGLGLAIVKIIVESHGGRVAVTSEPGKGSTFAMHIPFGLESTKASDSGGTETCSQAPGG